MNQEPRPASSIEERIAAYLRGWSQTASRRGTLARVGKILLRLSGLTLVPLLPLDRRFEVDAADHFDDGDDLAAAGDGPRRPRRINKCYWQTCGMCGTYCSTTCCGGTGGTSKCPSCSGAGGTMYQDGAWTACCYDSCTTSCSNATRYAYYDCCATTGSLAGKCAGSFECRHGCYPHFPTYCNNGRPYSCTIVVAIGSCNAC